jgi:hypothetical protein
MSTEPRSATMPAKRGGHGVAVAHVEHADRSRRPLASSGRRRATSAGRRATTVMRAPLAASARAVARPMPLEPPVMTRVSAGDAAHPANVRAGGPTATC